MTRNSIVGRITGMKSWFPVIGTMLALVFFVLGYSLRGNGTPTSIIQGDDEVFLLIYALFGKLSYFYSGIFFVISVVSFIWNSKRRSLRLRMGENRCQT